MQSYCPACEKISPASKIHKVLEYKVKGVDVSIDAPLVKCEECGSEFENPEDDSDVADLALRAYRQQTGLLQPEEVQRFRASLNLTQQELARLLGWGAATLSRYENGALQDMAHDNALRMIMEPEAMLGILDRNPDILSRKKHDQLVKLLQSNKNAESAFRTFFKRFLVDYDPDISSGFRRFSSQKFFSMILHFCRENGVSKTKLNKLLWYSDFLFFKQHTVSISGARYAHLPYGPGPDNYDLFLAYLTDIEGSLEVTTDSSGPYEWEVYKSAKEPDYSAFSNAELQTISLVLDRFDKETAKDLSDLSHDEVGYIATADGEIISYEFADSMNLFNQEENSMSKGRDRTVSRRTDGAWANKRNDSSKASSLHKTQRGAENAARTMLKKQGGGELTTKGKDGKIRSKDTIKPGNDPNPPRDKEN